VTLKNNNTSYYYEKGSGTTVQDVNTLIRQFDQARQMMKQFQGAKGGRKLKALMQNMKGLN